MILPEACLASAPNRARVGFCTCPAGLPPLKIVGGGDVRRHSTFRAWITRLVQCLIYDIHRNDKAAARIRVNSSKNLGLLPFGSARVGAFHGLTSSPFNPEPWRRCGVLHTYQHNPYSKGPEQDDLGIGDVFKKDSGCATRLVRSPAPPGSGKSTTAGGDARLPCKQHQIQHVLTIEDPSIRSRVEKVLVPYAGKVHRDTLGFC